MLYLSVALAAAVLFLIFARISRLERASMLIIGSSLLLGLAGYVAQGQPSLPQSLVVTSASNENQQIEAAFEAAKAKIAVDPQNAGHWTTLANALMARNRVLVPAADFAYQKALKINPDALDSAYFYGLALAESGRGDEAKAQWVRIAAQIPENEPRRKELLAAMFSTGIIREQDVSSTIQAQKR